MHFQFLYFEKLFIYIPRYMQNNIFEGKTNQVQPNHQIRPNFLNFFIIESRWEAPAEGYLSIKEQRDEQNSSGQAELSYSLGDQISAELAEQRKAKDAQEMFIQQKVQETKKKPGQMTFPSSTSTEYPKKAKIKKKVEIAPPTNFSTVQGPVARSEPFGAWKTVEQRYVYLFYQRQITLRIVEYHFSSRLRATLINFVQFTSKPHEHQPYYQSTCTRSLRQI